jgi:aromatic ring-opening dioxygenase catalytic subunit (LigB family)
MSTIFISNEQEMLLDLVNHGMTEDAATEFLQNLDSEIDLGMETIIKLEHHYIVDGVTAWYFKNEHGIDFIEMEVGDL